MCGLTKDRCSSFVVINTGQILFGFIRGTCTRVNFSTRSLSVPLSGHRFSHKNSQYCHILHDDHILQKNELNGTKLIALFIKSVIIYFVVVTILSLRLPLLLIIAILQNVIILAMFCPLLSHYLLTMFGTIDDIRVTFIFRLAPNNSL